MVTLNFKEKSAVWNHHLSVPYHTKEAVFNRMNALRGKVVQNRIHLMTMKLNERFDFELIPQGEEERRLRNKL